MKVMRSLVKVEGREEMGRKGVGRIEEGGSPHLVPQSPVSRELPPVTVELAVPEQCLHQRAEGAEGPQTDGHEGPHHHYRQLQARHSICNREE